MEGDTRKQRLEENTDEFKALDGKIGRQGLSEGGEGFNGAVPQGKGKQLLLRRI